MNINVIVIKESVVFSNYLFHDVKKAEDHFLDMCAIHISNFDEYTSHDKEVILDNGYETFGTDCSICITSPENV